MAKLSKEQIKNHEQALTLVELERDLTQDEKYFVLNNYHPGATHMNSKSGAFFTPEDIARELCTYTLQPHKNFQPHYVDICAGIGSLSRAVLDWYQWNDHKPKITCIEINAEYVRVGKKVVPEANWIHVDVFDFDWSSHDFDFAISNPPFGNIKNEGEFMNYQGKFDLMVAELAGTCKYGGVFIMPRQSVGFKFTSRGHEPQPEGAALKKFKKLNPHISIDPTSSGLEIYQDSWIDVKPQVELVEINVETPHNYKKEMEQIELFTA